MKKFIGIIGILFIANTLLSSCKNEVSTAENNNTNLLKIGVWRAVLEVQDHKELPFIIEVASDSLWTIQNAEERIVVTDINIYGDSIHMQTPVFEGVFKGKIHSSESISGDFIKPSLDRVVPFTIFFGDENRFETKQKATTNVTGNWETVFSPNIEEDSYIAKGIFKQEENIVTGTFRTTTGDYRYLEGVMEGDSLKLSTFDGAHAFLFEAKVTDTSMIGVFYSGNHWKEPFVAKRNDAYELPSANSLTYLKEGYNELAFTFPDTEGNNVSLTDERFKNKVVIVQIMGTWCPNCLDETKYYSQFLENHNGEDLEIVALAFEYAKTEEKAFLAINRLKDALQMHYPILLAQYGSSNKKEANEKLPMLNHILSYPTSIFIDKKGAIRKIHTGFNGPATGEKYLEFTEEFEDFVNKLLEE